MNSASLAADRPFVLVVALDLKDTPSGAYALDQGARIAKRIPGCQMHVVYVSRDVPAQDVLGLLRHYVSERLALAEQGPPPAVCVHVRHAEPAEEITRFAADLAADVVIVGTHKPTQLKTLFVGSTAERVMAHAICPVLVAGPRPKLPASHIIVIEPPCPDCVQTRLDTRGGTWWCARHSEHHSVLRHHHVYSYEGPAFEGHDSTVSATGVD